MSQEQANLISFEQLQERTTARQEVEFQFPTEVIDEHNSLSRLRALKTEGLGTLITTNHFCRDDLKRLMAALFRDPAFERARVITAIGLHEFDTYNHFAKAAGITAYPVTTQGTIDTLGDKAPPLGTGMEEFMAASIKSLGEGDDVLFIPQGGRRPRLSRSEGKILQTLFGDAEDANVRFATLFTGIGINGDGSYTNRDYHYGEDFILRLGQVYTDQELLSTIEGDDDYQKMRKIDTFWEDQTRSLVPPEYR